MGKDVTQIDADTQRVDGDRGARGADTGPGNGGSPGSVAVDRHPVARVTGKFSPGEAVMVDPMAAMIERVARDPSVDIDRLERLIAMKERAEAQRARALFDAALSAMQPELPVIERRASIKHGEKLIAKYASWESIAVPVADVLAQHGFSLTFRAEDLGGKVKVTAILAHRDGHREETSYPFPVDAGPGRNAIQAHGSSISYGKRYTACTLLNIITRGEDDDGRATAGGLISDEQVAELTKLITATKTDIRKFLELGKIESLTEITQAQFPKAWALLLAKQRGTP